MCKNKFKNQAKEDKGEISCAKEIKVTLTNTSKTMRLLPLAIIFSLESPQWHWKDRITKGDSNPVG